jgi:hypothetical protein
MTDGRSMKRPAGSHRAYYSPSFLWLFCGLGGSFSSSIQLRSAALGPSPQLPSVLTQKYVY